MTDDTTDLAEFVSAYVGHHNHAIDCLDSAYENGGDASENIAIAQVHATLALAAATGMVTAAAVPYLPADGLVEDPWRPTS